MIEHRTGSDGRLRARHKICGLELRDGLPRRLTNRIAYELILNPFYRPALLFFQRYLTISWQWPRSCDRACFRCPLPPHRRGQQQQQQQKQQQHETTASHCLLSTPRHATPCRTTPRHVCWHGGTARCGKQTAEDDKVPPSSGGEYDTTPPAPTPSGPSPTPTDPSPTPGPGCLRPHLSLIWLASA